MFKNLLQRCGLEFVMNTRVCCIYCIDAETSQSLIQYLPLTLLVATYYILYSMLLLLFKSFVYDNIHSTKDIELVQKINLQIN